MGIVVTLSKTTSPVEAKKALAKLSARKEISSKNKTLKDFFGRLPHAFGDGLEYQKRMRNEWE